MSPSLDGERGVSKARVALMPWSRGPVEAGVSSCSSGKRRQRRERALLPLQVSVAQSLLGVFSGVWGRWGWVQGRSCRMDLGEKHERKKGQTMTGRGHWEQEVRGGGVFGF